MKKALLIISSVILSGLSSMVNAQCYGTVHFDQSSSANGNSSFSISTTFCNELIMIAYDGWRGPGAGPVKVDGNNATHINTANNNVNFPSSGAAETYAYIAPNPGVHNIACTETGNSILGNTKYDLNLAASFYLTGTINSFSIASLTTTDALINCDIGGPITGNINTTIPNSMIFTNVEYNDGNSSADPISFTGGNFIDDLHVGQGIEVADAYTSALAPGPYTITADNTFANNSAFCGGLEIILVAIPPPLCGTPLSVVATSVNPTCGNLNGSINLVASGGVAPYTYTWTPAISSSASATGLSSGVYSIIVSDGACPAEDTTIVITITGPVLNVNTTVTANENCNGNCIGSATTAIVGGTAPFTYLWTPSGITTASATGLCAGTYSVVASDANGCSQTNIITVTEPPLLTVTNTVTNALCNGGTGSIAASALGGTPPYTYLWAPSGQTNATATGLSAGIYVVGVADNNGCTASANATIIQPALLTDTITGQLTLCANEPGSLTANVTGGTAPYLFTWSTGATTAVAPIMLTSTQTYTSTVTDANGCTATATYTVSLSIPTTINITATRTSMCEGFSTTIIATSTNATGAFTWEPGGFNGPAITVTPTITTTYTASVPGGCGIATSTITINVNQLPVTDFGVDNASGCAPFCAQFRDRSTTTSGRIAEWVWNFGNGDTAEVQNPIYCYPNSGDYNVNLTAVSDSGCSSTLNVTDFITVYSHPIANFTTSPQPTTILQPQIQFTDNSTDAYGLAYWVWNFGVAGNDTLSNLQNPSYSYWDTGTYCVSEVVMNQHGCVDTVTNCLVISPVFSLYIPDAFSPNSDGKNDVFMAKGKEVTSFDMYIFDRWGSQLFHSSDINIGWDGTVKGGSTVSQEDTYVYLITAYDNKNQKHSYLGKVNLIK
jgi:gliding motility-associated-like protein